jgi:hypothetical protein
MPREAPVTTATLPANRPEGGGDGFPVFFDGLRTGIKVSPARIVH